MEAGARSAALASNALMAHSPRDRSGAGRSPRRPRRWVDGQRRRRASPLFRRLDHSFGFRLLMAGAAALALLAAVNRFENCRINRQDPNCLSSNALDVISIGHVESLSIVTAALLFILEGPKRRRREHVEAMELVMAAQQAGVVRSYARLEALETLNEAGIWLDGLDLSGADLEGLHAEHGHWRGTDLSRTLLQDAHFNGSDLSGCSLRNADLRRAELRGADLSGAVLAAADLRDADLTAANLRAADLRGADLRGAVLRETCIEDAVLEGAKLEGTLLDPLPANNGLA